MNTSYNTGSTGFDAQVGFFDDTFTRSDYMSDSEYMGEAFYQYADTHGEEDTEREWINTPFDTWVRNPHYRGVPGRHPEDDYYDDE